MRPLYVVGVRVRVGDARGQLTGTRRKALMPALAAETISPISELYEIMVMPRSIHLAP